MILFDVLVAFAMSGAVYVERPRRSKARSTRRRQTRAPPPPTNPAARAYTAAAITDTSARGGQGRPRCPGLYQGQRRCSAGKKHYHLSIDSCKPPPAIKIIKRQAKTRTTNKTNNLIHAKYSQQNKTRKT